jgi:hypothetical protein
VQAHTRCRQPKNMVRRQLATTSGRH